MDPRNKQKENENNQYYKRTNEARIVIDQSFQSLIQSQQQRKCGYVFRGNPSYAFVLHGLRVDSESILDAKTEKMESHSHPVVVLDIGAGDFSFNHFNDQRYKGMVISYGIAANDIFRNTDNQVNDEFHVFGNAEYICSNAFQPDKFDYIFSARTFMHFVDPVGSVIEAYNALKPGGVLIIDQFDIPGCENITAHVVAYLQSQGYSMTAGNCFNNISQIVIQKTSNKPELEFPLRFNGINNNHVQYYPNEKLLQFCKSNNLNEIAYNYAKQKIIEDVIREIGSDIFDQCNDIPSLLVNKTYQHLNPEMQYKCILAMVAMMTDIKEYNDIVLKCIKLDHDHHENAFNVLYKQNLKMTDHSILHMLANDAHFKMYQNSGKFTVMESVHQQLRVITLAVMEDIIRLANAMHAQEQLDGMGVPFRKMNFHQFVMKSPFDFANIIKHYDFYYVSQCLGDGRKGDPAKRISNNMFGNIHKILDTIPALKDKLAFLQVVYELIEKNDNQLYTHTDSHTPGFTHTQVLHITALKDMYLNIAKLHTSDFIGLINQDIRNKQNYNPYNPSCLINKNVNVVNDFFGKQTTTNKAILEIIEQHQKKSMKHK